MRVPPDQIEGTWLKVVNPDGNGYSKGDYTAIHIKVIDANKESGDGFDAYEESTSEYIGDKWIETGINIECLDQDVTIHSRFHFEIGAVLVASKNHNKGHTKIYWKLIGGELRHNNIGVSGGLMVAPSTYSNFSFKTNGKVTMTSCCGYSDDVGYGINGILHLNPLTQNLKNGNYSYNYIFFH